MISLTDQKPQAPGVSHAVSGKPSMACKTVCCPYFKMAVAFTGWSFPSLTYCLSATSSLLFPRPWAVFRKIELCWIPRGARISSCTLLIHQLAWGLVAQAFAPCYKRWFPVQLHCSQNILLCHRGQYGDCGEESTEISGELARGKGGTRFYWWLNPFSSAQAAICLREVKPSFNRILLTCVSMVRSLSTKASAISRLDFSCAIRAAISRSRSVSPPYVCLAACFSR